MMSQPPSPSSSNPRSLHHHHHHPHRPISSLPDLFLTALSLLFLFSPSKSNSPPSFCPVLKIPFSLPPNTRRFLRSPVMSSNHPLSPSKSQHHPFSNPQALSDWLRPRLPSDCFASWGTKPGTKNVHNLWLELAEGETSLADSTPPVRTVEVVTVRIKRSDTNRGNVVTKVLVESHQELSDGTIRYRNRPLSEKMKPGETVDRAVMRAIREELGSLVYDNSDKEMCENRREDIVRIVEESYGNRVEERASASYPGLPACYVLHTVDAFVDGLPEGEFETEEENEYQDCQEMKIADKAVSVRRHYWKWVDSDEIQGCGSLREQGAQS